MDYRVYILSRRQKAEVFAESIGLTVLISWLFYDSFWAFVFLPAVYFFLRKLRVQKEKEQRDDHLTMEFLEMLRSLTTALTAGYSMENAWREGQKEVAMMYGSDSCLVAELQMMNQAVRMNVPLEDTLMEFAVRSGIEEIYQFAEVFRFAKRSGGNMVGILESTAARISGKYETQKEITVVIAAKAMEQKVMNSIPLFILAYLKLTAGDYLNCLYGNLLGGCFMTVCLLAYGGIILLSQKILDIQV